MYSSGTISEALPLDLPALPPPPPGRALIGVAAIAVGAASTAGLAAAAAAAWVILASLTTNPTLETNAPAGPTNMRYAAAAAPVQVAPRVVGLANPYGTLKGAARLNNSAAAIYFSPTPMDRMAANGFRPFAPNGVEANRLAPAHLASPVRSVASVAESTVQQSAQAAPAPSPFVATAEALAAARSVPLPPERSLPGSSDSSTPLPPLRTTNQIASVPTPPQNPFFHPRSERRPERVAVAPERRPGTVAAPNVRQRGAATVAAAEPRSPQPSNPIAAFFAALSQGGADTQSQEKMPALPGVGPQTAIYDIAAHTVYLPDGERLEAHSGLGNLIDNPRFVNQKDRGATPPHLYNLSLRGQLFHGVRAIRLNPVGGGAMYGRVGLLAHTYMLGPNGQSNGCISFRDYPRFLHAYLSGQIQHLQVVAHLNSGDWRRMASRSGVQYASN